MRGPDCSVYVDGVLVADDYAPDLARVAGEPGEPALLSGLTVRWGRETTVDQPDAGTATMRLLDPPGGRVFADLFRVGAALRVEAVGPAWSDTEPGQDGETWGPNIVTYGTFDDPAVDYAAVIHFDPTRGSGWGRITQTPFAGAGAMRWAQTDPRQANSGSFMFCPGPMPAPGDPPGGWDAIPRWGQASSQWSVAFHYRAQHADAFFHRALIRDPATASQPSSLGDMHRVTHTGPTWQPVSWTSTLNWADPTWFQAWPALYCQVMPASWDRPVDLAGVSWSAGPATTWADTGTLDVDELTIRPDVDTQRRVPVLVFAGRITDLSVALEGDEPVIDLTAADIAAELGNRMIGDVPWPASTAAVRLDRIVKAAGNDLTVYLDPAAGAFPVSLVDVDNRAALDLLHQLAASTDSTLWAGSHPTTGAYLRIEHARSRAPLFALHPGPDGLLVVSPAAGSRVPQISACDLLAAPARFAQDVADVLTVAAVGWLEQITDDQGKPGTVERTATARADPQLLAALGTRRLALSTILATEQAARTVAEGILARHTSTDYRASGLLLRADELPDAEMSLLTRLLDGTARNGQPLILVDLPEWAPADDAVPLYLEGGTYSYVNGEWALDLVVSSAAASGSPLPWNGAGATRWVDYAPAVAWRSLIGVQPVTKPNP